MSGHHYAYHYPSGHASYSYAASTSAEGYASVPAGYQPAYPASYASGQVPLSSTPSGHTHGLHGSGQLANVSHAHYPPNGSHYQTQLVQPGGYTQSTPATYYPSAYSRSSSTAYHPSYSGYERDDSVLATTESMSHLRIPSPSISRSTSSGRAKSPASGKTWTCDVPDCPSTAQFTRMADLQRHQATVHNTEPNKPFPCSVPRCSRVGPRGFTRRDHLTEHLRSYHHLDIRKRRPGERSAAPV
ncbi:hypothetical protein GQ43DRAFT_38192 [Delitschia confertaspora ATCC 74209]|uniref:C2H2-type domain-containing protein n=1 Tax=Delitschia confertaspora ATCC 74209 TaxID=1513339 RepID=A0A9P4MSF6_9PLEO|nr:hypothetical protein GQ43DRAFT_38192 [Delitschia confertaspora ATCC 74209]